MSGTVVIETDADKVQLFVDDDLKGIVGRATPLTIPGLATGPHTVKAAKEGYKPEIKQITIIPGIALSVTIRMRFPYAPKRSALQLNESGDKLLRTRRSTLNPMMIIPGIQSQSAGDIRRARDLFTQALREDPDYSEAAYNLGVANQLLRDDAASAAAYRQAIDLDPTYTQARLEYADILISTGDPDGAIRQLTEALRFEPANDEIHARLAGAYWGRSAWNECVAAAGQALTLNSRNFSAHFRRGDCLRQLAVAEPAAARKASLFSQARESYQTFVTLTNYSTPALSWVAFHFLGTGLGRRVHADRKDTYKVWRNEGYLGLCICEKALGNLLRARGHCARATDYLPDDAMSYFFLGNVNRDLFITTKACEYVAHSRLAYQKMLSLNPNLAEAKNARFYLDQFDGMRQALRQRGCT
jgi:tetratricopeptide (TPR) repeat protein